VTDQVLVSATIINATNRPSPAGTVWTIEARIVSVNAKVPAEAALVGLLMKVDYVGYLLPRMSVRSGLLFRAALPLEVAEAALDQVAKDNEPVITCQVSEIRPMAEPCVRVPLSLLRELRGQEARAEMSRRSLVKTWGEDRRTGKMASKA
jgi:hypothetical protein